MATEYKFGETLYRSIGSIAPDGDLRWDTPAPRVRLGGNIWSFADPAIPNRGDSLLARTTVGAPFAREGALYAKRTPHRHDHYDHIEYFMRVSG